MSFDLKNRITLITGAARGLGLEQARAFIDSNARVVITDLSEESLAEARKELGSDRVFTYRQDVTEFDATPSLIKRIESEVGPIDYLINNAGVHLKKPIWDVSTPEWQNIVNINLTGTFVTTREVVTRMKERQFGSIVIISSMAGLMALPTAAGYVATKTGLVGLARSVAVDAGPFNVRCNAVCPGFIDTEMTRKVLAGDPQRAAKITGRIPMPRLGLGSDIASSCVFLCSEEGAYINGQSLPIDGGFSVGF